jgi:hypothetical protein
MYWIDVALGVKRARVLPNILTHVRESSAPVATNTAREIANALDFIFAS